ncbi:aminotransferase class I and II family protein [Piscirickettsia salmonis]|uniref:8-amino-7-oxononanoate synthase n=1 Tax=Piscirickettsia salmonis TaxID=1238 RepID=A0A9Q6LN93_PISSA|nr:8-amino-7-oxononanoate synthase [Piscirickettsia salmonis]ALA25920.1 aminotransferase class I and II family protein [Piscirickettsia salmonis]APS43391.1 aminotransferase class I and II family protein [Piscirickettsia salmonis]APS46742.1 aminotransferase class I and II family protein [Piscirickettsia salmonis]APS50715.1 aminotransferase class I and II family protein [Piscirickettsia salmonis]APS53919.1 aminotransferase class I and II family protein [Piscirickettsia salmonis]
MALFAKLESQLMAHQEKQRMRIRYSMQQGEYGRCQVAGECYVNFASNDYLGLSQHHALKQAAVQAINHYGVGSGSSAQVTGFHPEHEALQKELAEWLQVDAVLLYSSGYMANIGTLTALLSSEAPVIHDRENHASLLDGSLQAHAHIRRFAHNNMQDLTRLLKKLTVRDMFHQLDKSCNEDPVAKNLAGTSTKRSLWVVSEALFSMDGHQVPMAELLGLIERYQVNALLDETHSLGIFGEQGRGLSTCLSQLPENGLMTAGLGKAFGVMGGIAAGSCCLIEYLTQFSRSAIYTTAQPPAWAAAARASLALIRSREGDELRERLQTNIDYFLALCKKQGVVYEEGSLSPIQVIILKTEQRALQWQQALKEQGFWVAAMRPPSVAQGASRLRITVTAAHCKADIQRFVEALAYLQEQAL